MEDAGVTVSDIQTRRGHTSLSTTGRYLAALNQAENVYGDTLAQLFGFGEAYMWRVRVWDSFVSSFLSHPVQSSCIPGLTLDNRLQRRNLLFVLAQGHAQLAETRDHMSLYRQKRHIDRRHRTGYPLAAHAPGVQPDVCCSVARALGNPPAVSLPAATSLQQVPGNIAKRSPRHVSVFG